MRRAGLRSASARAPVPAFSSGCILRHAPPPLQRTFLVGDGDVPAIEAAIAKAEA
jgi:hypothetical protein